ncbi:MAG: hypothetical protein E7660_02610 [Ruminococcaceae bacterium]|nr:hypothetical protein [Oscillospiraceae bacterium]
MKRLLCIVLAFLMLFALYSCNTSSIKEGSEVTLIFAVGEKNISEKLTDEEAARMIEILDGNSLTNRVRGVPSCSFDENVAIKIGSRTYAIALDTCGTVMETGSLKYFNISDEDIAYIHSVFEKYGGYFPCV